MGAIRIETIGELTLDKPLDYFDKNYLTYFHSTPHYKRDPDKLQEIFKGENGYKFFYGGEGQFFIRTTSVGEGGIQKDIGAITDFENPPYGQPSIFCPWKPNEEGNKILPDRKITYYSGNLGWLRWLISNFFKSRYTVNGTVYIINKSFGKVYEVKVVNNVIHHKTYKDYELSLNIDSDLIEKLKDFTTKSNITWKYKKSKGEKNIYNIYYTVLPINSTISLRFTLNIRRDKEDMSYMSVHMVKKNTKETKFIKNIKNIKGLVEMIDLLFYYNLS